MAALAPTSCLLYRELCHRELRMLPLSSGGACSSVAICGGGIDSLWSGHGRWARSRAEAKAGAFWQSTSRLTLIEMEAITTTEDFDRILAASQEHCNPVLVAQEVYAGVYKGVTTSQLDELAAETAAAMTANHPDYASLAARITVSNLHKNMKKSFSETVKLMHTHFNERSGQEAPLIADDVYEIIMNNAARLDSEIIYDRDFDYDYFGFKTLERSYFLKVSGKVVERPQHTLMRNPQR